MYVIETGSPAVRMVRPDGILTTVAGDSYREREEGGFGGDGGSATQAELNAPLDLATGHDGSLYIADTYNNRVRKVTPDGVITTFAGTGERADRGDGGLARDAAMIEPNAIAVDAEGNVYVGGLHSDRLRKIDPTGRITTHARFPTQRRADPRGEPATEVMFHQPDAIAVDRAGTLYVSSGEGLRAVRQDGTIGATIAEGAGVMACGQDGSLYLSGDQVERRYPDGTRAVIAGGGPVRKPFPDGQPANTAAGYVTDMAIGPRGGPYLATKDQVYRLTRDGTLRLAAKAPWDGEIDTVAVDGQGAVYLVDYEGFRVMKADRGKTTTFAGVGDRTVIDDDIGDDGPATEAILRYPTDMVVATDGTAYVSTLDGIRSIDPDGTITTIVPADRAEEGGMPTLRAPKSLALDSHGNLYFTEPERHRVRVIVRPGSCRARSRGSRCGSASPARRPRARWCSCSRAAAGE